MRERRYWVVAIPAALAVAVAILAYRQVNKAEEWGRHQRFVGDAAVLADRVESSLTAHMNIVRGLRGLFEASENVTEREFETYAGALEAASPRPTAVAYSVRLRHADRAAFEAAQRAAGHDGYHVKEVTGDASLRRAEERDIYYPVVYKLWGSFQGVYGFDVYSHPARRAAIETAVRTGEPTATAPIDLVGGGARRGFLLMQAVGKDDQTAGLVMAVFRANELVQNAVGFTRPAGLTLQVEDITDPDEASPLYSESGDTLAEWSHTFELTGRRWRLRVGMSPSYENGQPFLAYGVLGGGLAFAVLVGMLLWELTGRHTQVAREVRQRTAELETSESRYRTLFEAAGVALWEEDLTDLMARFDALRAEGVSSLERYLAANPGSLAALARLKTVTAVNAETVQLFAATSRDELLDHLDTVFGEASMDGVRAQLLALWRGNRTFEREMTAQRLDGQPIQVYIRQRLSGTSDLPHRALVSLSDITRLKEAETRLRSQMDQLERSNAELERFAYIASHDLQEPLRAISRFADLLGEDYRGRLDEDADEYIHYIVDGAQRMQQLIEDLLAYSRLGRKDNPPETLPLDEVLDDVLADLSANLLDSGAQILRQPLPVVHGDAGELRQLMMNLVSNALKFRRTTPHVVEISSTHADGRVLVKIQDNGTGIDPSCVDRIFEVFYRGHSRSKYPGTGIGLAICKRVVEEHGGRIHVESTLGVGTTFYVELPEARVDADAA